MFCRFALSSFCLVAFYISFFLSSAGICQNQRNQSSYQAIADFGFKSIDQDGHIFLKEINGDKYLMYFNPEIGLINFGADGHNEESYKEELIDQIWYEEDEKKYLWQSSFVDEGGYRDLQASGGGGRVSNIKKEQGLKDQLIANGFRELRSDLNLWFHQASSFFGCIVEVSKDGNFILEIYFSETEKALESPHIKIINFEPKQVLNYYDEIKDIIYATLERPDLHKATFGYEIHPRGSSRNKIGKDFFYREDILDWSDLDEKIKKYRRPELDSRTGFTYGGVNVPLDSNLPEIRAIDSNTLNDPVDINMIESIRHSSIEKIENIMQPYDGPQHGIKVGSGFLNSAKGDTLLGTLDEDNRTVLLDLKTTHQQLALLVNLATKTTQRRSHSVTRIRFFGVEFEISVNPFYSWAGLNNSPFFDESTGGQDYIIKNLSAPNTPSLFITDLHVNSFIHDYGFYEGKGVGNAGTDRKTGISYSYRVDPEQIMRVFSTEGTIESSFLRNRDFPLEELFELQYK